MSVYSLHRISFGELCRWILCCDFDLNLYLRQFPEQAEDGVTGQRFLYLLWEVKEVMGRLR